MDSPLKCFNQALSSRLSSQCSNNELLGYLLAVLYYSDYKTGSPLHISVVRSHILGWIDTKLNELNRNERFKLRALVLDIITRLERTGYNWLYFGVPNLSMYSYKNSSVMDHSTGLSEEAGCLYTGEERRSNIFSGNGRK